MQLWIDTGDNPHKFVKTHGLCSNLILFIGPNSKDFKYRFAILNLLGKQFADAGLDEFEPFRSDQVWDEGFYPLVYKNPARLRWIKEHAASV